MNPYISVSKGHAGKGDYYAATEDGYEKFENVEVTSPNPIVTLEPFSRCHYLMPGPEKKP